MRHLLGRARSRFAAIPFVVRVVALIALLNGLGWALLTPPFQVPDEPAHFAYVQRVAESGQRPGDPKRPEFSTEQVEVLGAIRTLTVIGRVLEKPPRTEEADRAADEAIERAERGAPRDDGGGVSGAAPQPALYYALAAVPYRLTAWTSLPTRVTAVRAMGALFLALTAAMVALLALEFLPGRTWAALVAGCAVALHPVIGFISAGVTPDGLLMLLSTSLLFAVIRAFRLGLTRQRGVVIGAIAGAGIVTKLTFLAFIPPAALAVAVLLWRDRERSRGEGDSTARALSRAAIPIVAALVVLPALYFIWSKLQGMPWRAAGSSTPGRVVTPNLREEFSYIWQLYLPRLPWQIDQFGFPPLTETWLKGLVGRYGWLDYSTPIWMVDVARWIVRVGVLLAAVTLVRYRRVVRRRWMELAALALFVVSLLVVIGHAGYPYLKGTGYVFEQARYVFPLVAIYALGVVAACAAMGRRFAPLLAAACVGLFAVHDLSGVLLTLARYQG